MAPPNNLKKGPRWTGKKIRPAGFASSSAKVEIYVALLLAVFKKKHKIAKNDIFGIISEDRKFHHFALAT